MKYPLKEKIKYRFFSLIENSLWYFILILFIITILFVLFMSIPIIISNNADKFGSVWENIATVINAWWPSASSVTVKTTEAVETGVTQQVQVDMLVLIIRSIIAIFGLFFTSIMIGIVAEYITNIVNTIRFGQTKVLEHNHIILAGYDNTNRKLLYEILNSTHEKTKLLIIDEKPRESILDDIKTNYTIPKNMKIIIRTMKLWDIESLRKCSIETCSKIIISPLNDISTMKTIMAIMKILHNYPDNKTVLSSSIYNEQYLVNFSNPNWTMFSINNLESKIIAMSINKNNTSLIFNEIFSFDGYEFYINKINNISNKIFKDLICNSKNIIAIGIYRDNNYMLYPDENEVILENDEIIYYAENRQREVVFKNTNETNDDLILLDHNIRKNTIYNEVVIFGQNNNIPILIKNLDDSVKTINLILFNDKNYNHFETLKQTFPDKTINIEIIDDSNEFLVDKLTKYERIVLLNNDYVEQEESDTYNMMLYLKLIKIRQNLHLHNNITIELFSDQNRMLISEIKNCDFIISKNIISMILAQAVENIKLKPMFMQLLTSDELHIDSKTVNDLFDEKQISFNDLNYLLYKKGIILLGIIKTDDTGTNYFESYLETKSVKNTDELVLLYKE